MNKPGSLVRSGHWLLPGLLALAAAGLQASGLVEELRFERELALGEPWRLLTGHMVHLGWMHLVLNIAGLAAVWLIVGDALHPLAWLCVMLVAAATVSVGLLLLSPEIAWYVGLSGVLHGMLAAGAIASLKARPMLGWALLALLAGKLLLEWQAGGDSAVSSLVGGAVITDAHLYGAVAGVICGAGARILQASRA
jgi:rhomboid family GlyGly-CTERM serine protease